VGSGRDVRDGARDHAREHPARHPAYDEYQARMALYRLLVGDELFRRAWPAEPLLAP
jgi:hypothetical protein